MNKLLATLLFVAVSASAAHAGFKTVGQGDAIRLDTTSLPPVMKANYEILQTKCVKCHTLERAFVAVRTGVAPISGQPFDRSATKAYGIKMLRKAESNMTKAEVKASVELLNYLLLEMERGNR